MAYKLTKNSISLALRHLCRYGDTDVFPHLPELAFFTDNQDAVVSEISKLDLENYDPSGAIEALAPKNRYGFRIVHQLPALETLLLTASVAEIGQEIEKKRQSKIGYQARSYRFMSDESTGQFFSNDRTYKDWLHLLHTYVEEHPNINQVVCTDISDFYARINYHRLENLLDEAAPTHGAVRYIKKQIKAIRARQSFGLPVGGSAARLLAELALTDTDQALRDEGIRASRFVDDYRILLKKNDDPYDALGFLAEQLGINEGLSLNVAKTKVISRKEFLAELSQMTSDITKEAEGDALETLTAELYFEDEPDEAQLEKLKGMNLVQLLSEELSGDDWDMGRIKVIFRALKITTPEEAVKYVEKNFSKLTVFAKELCLLMDALKSEYPGCFDGLTKDVVNAILNPPAQSVQLIRTWLLEIFVRGIIEPTTPVAKKLNVLQGNIDQQKLLLIHGRCNNKNYFRKQKTAVAKFSPNEVAYLIWGASCLPKDEFENWISTLKGKFRSPLWKLYLEWTLKNRETLTDKLDFFAVEHFDS